MILRRTSFLPFISFGLMVLFLLGTTPRQFVHDLCQDHQHATSLPDNDHQPQLNEADYYCGYNTPVATVPYLPTPYIHFTVIQPTSAAYYSQQVYAVVEQESIRTSLRGPPAVV
jgi:hypothetical protein